MGLMVKIQSFASIIAGGNLDRRFQHDLNELSAAVVGLLHHTGGAVGILNHRDIVRRAEMQIGEHVTGRKTGDQQILWIVAGSISAKRRIARPQNLSLAFNVNRVVAAIASIGLRALSVVAGPLDSHFVIMASHVGTSSYRAELSV